MLGPLPPLYRWVVGLLALVVCAGLGAWLAWTLPGPLLVQTGALLGAAFGGLVAGLLLHGSQRPAHRFRQRRHQ